MDHIRSFALMLTGSILLVPAVFGQSDLISIENPALKTYQGNRDQFTLELPEGWYVVDQSPQSRTGVIAFYSQPLNTKLDKDPVISKQQEQAMIGLVNDMLSGALPFFIVDRYKAEKGMTCAGFDERAQKRKLKIFKNSSAFGDDARVVGTPEISTTEFGGCKGIKAMVLAEGYASLQMLVYSAAVDGITYDIALVTETKYFEQNLPWFERTVASVQLTGAR